MIVHFMATYYSQWAHENLAPRSQDQWYSFKFCRAVKSRRLNGSLILPWAAGPEVINEQSVGRARIVFGFFLQYILQQCGFPAPVLVPIPSKDGLIGAPDFRSWAMLREALATVQPFRIAPILRFNQILQPAHAGGPRGRNALRPFLVATEALPQGQIILVDDIVTTGGTLLASFDALSALGRPPATAIVCGHTVSDSMLSAFGVHQKAIDTTPQQFSF